MTELRPPLLQAASQASGTARLLIGSLLLESGRLNSEQVERIADRQKKLGIRFGEAGIKLGLLTEPEVQFALSAQYGYKYLKPGQGNFSAELIAAYDPFSRQVEALRKLRTELLLRWFNPDHRLLAVVSTSPEDGRSYLCANLAVAFAQLGENTLVMDCDMRNPRLHRIFNVDDSTGLSSILSGRASSYGSRITQIGALPHLHVLPAGPIPPNPLELLGQPGFAVLLAHVAKRYEVVLIDTPSSAAHADAQVIAARAGGALMLVRRNRTRAADLKRLTEAIGASATPIVGATMNHK